MSSGPLPRCSGTAVRFQELRWPLGVILRLSHEKQRMNKHVESLSVSCLDAGSTPAISTKKEDALGILFFYFIGLPYTKRSRFCRFSNPISRKITAPMARNNRFFRSRLLHSNSCMLLGGSKGLSCKL